MRHSVFWVARNEKHDEAVRLRQNTHGHSEYRAGRLVLDLYFFLGKQSDELRSYDQKRKSNIHKFILLYFLILLCK